MRFRKRVKVFPGFYVNFSSSGVSTTLGVRGASINISKRGTYLNTGIPGTGLYDRRKISGGSSAKDRPVPAVENRTNQTSVSRPLLKGEIKSADVADLTSSTLVELKESLLEAFKDKRELAEEIIQTNQTISSAKQRLLLSKIFIVGFFVKSFKQTLEERLAYLSDLQQQLSNCKVDIEIDLPTKISNEFSTLQNTFIQLSQCAKIWDITSSNFNDRKATRSAANSVVTRSLVKFSLETLSIVKSTTNALHFENKNGGDLYIFPAFVVLTSDSGEFALIDIKDLQIHFAAQRFLEEEQIPADAQIIDRTWAKVNKNGSPDKRFKDNYQIPIVQYGQIDITSSSGVNESYSFSSLERAREFAAAFDSFQATVS